MMLVVSLRMNVPGKAESLPTEKQPEYWKEGKTEFMML